MTYELNTGGPLGNSDIRLSCKVVEMSYQTGHNFRQSGIGFGARCGYDSVGKCRIVLVRIIAWLVAFGGSHLVVSSDRAEYSEV